MKTSDLLVACLEAEGVEHVFGLPGEELEDILFSLADSPIEFVPVRHEQGAAFMADVHGRLTGDAGVCLSTLGPGATNLMTGVADAHLDKSPVVAITGQGSRERLHQESHQLLDVVNTFAPITKWNTRLDDPAIVHESVRKAFKLAELEKPGATHLELPEDIAAADSADEPIRPRERRVRRAAPDPGAVERAVEVLAGADRPLVLAGNGAVRTRAAEQLRAFVEGLNAPTVATYMGKGAVSDADEHSLLTLDSGTESQAERVIDRADTVLAVGYDIAEHDPENWNPDGEKRIVHLDFEPAEVYEHYVPEVEVVCDIAAGLEALCAADLDPTGDDWYADLRQALATDVTRAPTEDEPLSVRRALPIVRDVLADEDVLISDVGSHKMAIARHYPTYEPNTCIVSNGLASMGIAVPGAVAADLVTDGNVVAATGDGGFLMNAAELETAGRLGCSFTVLLFNDDDYGLIREKQSAHRGGAVGTALGNPDFPAFAESFGVSGHRVDSWDDFRETFAAAVASDDLSLVEVPLARVDDR
ncbi:acetolactate synthase large subunit [Halomarina ordinaria]|uniref:Acetolactate synthase large subunit n=1 Tax=Halomarina ordinaria TaxID=3033939 RepID=A0ABD5U3S8_9EURY|nr:acetolactate synthase large subunit [Halomarina sp. PSRA2]